MKKVAIALGGGGAKFFTHLGMLHVLKENKIPMDFFACSSMGAIAGSLVANDVPIDDIKKAFFKKRHKIFWFKPAFHRFGLLSQSQIGRIMDNLLPKKNIEDSKVPFVVIAANILNGKPHIFKRGSIKNAVLASCAFPGIFPPVKYQDKLLVDGGVLNNIPADICRQYIGSKNIVISSSVDATLKCKIEDIHTSLDVYTRVIYMPLYEKRLRIARKNSDIFIQHFKDKKLSLGTQRDLFKVLRKKHIENFFNIGVKNTEKYLSKIKKLIN